MQFALVRNRAADSTQPFPRNIQRDSVGEDRQPTSAQHVATTHASSDLGQQPQHLDLDSNQNRDLRRVACDPLHHLGSIGRAAEIRELTLEVYRSSLFSCALFGGTPCVSPRRDSHPHDPVYESDACLRRATSAIPNCSGASMPAKICTPIGRVGNGYAAVTPLMRLYAAGRQPGVAATASLAIVDSGRFLQGCPRGIEPLPSASQTDVQKPLHHGHHLCRWNRTLRVNQLPSMPAANGSGAQGSGESLPAEGARFELAFPRRGNRFSKPARQAISGYLP